MLIQTPSVPSDYNRWFPPVGELPADPERRALIWQEAFESFSQEVVFTVDEVDKVHPRKPLDLYGSMAYLRIPIYGFMRYNRLYWCKSRKVAATITLSELLTWCVHYWPVQRWGWITQKQDDGMKVIEEYIKDGYIESLPKWFKARYTYGRAKGHLVIKRRDDEMWNSTIWAYPTGADQPRQFAHSGLVVDEAHTMSDLPDLIQGAAPGLRASAGKEGGKLVLVFPARRGAPVERYIGSRGRQAIRLANERLHPAA